ncbi:protein phosphatase inhibitor 2 family member C [Marmota monax]|uniref:Protein phosphatase inhibitor 2 family member C n=1 Tax=Marmota monax TaxID=9995 RepID=A0A5E4BZ29_MARMO|nr:protein phosphatase inhibitor 2 family member C [Marmota monax]KAF7469874.1 hypothetical protein GHT09_018680 [Marmota monax]VTJ74241.1 Hypothetical predicted protein [Marmota monax]
MAASTTSHRPIKGILKNKVSTSSSVASPAQPSEGATQEVQRKKSQRWDESNILETRRSSYRDYDLMKINEPGTLCVSVQDDGEDPSEVEAKEDMTPDILAKKLAATNAFGPDCQEEEQDSSEAHTSKYLLDKQEKQRQFEMKRKLHYNEGLNIKLARQLISEDLQAEAEEDKNQESLHFTNEEKSTTEEAHTMEELHTQSTNA